MKGQHMRLQAISRKIAILVSFTAGLTMTVQANAFDVAVHNAVLSADRNFADCTKKANYNGEVTLCMGAALEKYKAIAKKLPHNDTDQQAYEYALTACSMVEDPTSSWACGLSVVKFHLHQGDIVEYMSNGKYNTGQ